MTIFGDWFYRFSISCVEIQKLNKEMLKVCTYLHHINIKTFMKIWMIMDKMQNKRFKKEKYLNSINLYGWDIYFLDCIGNKCNFLSTTNYLIGNVDLQHQIQLL